MSKENIEYRAIVERIAEILHGGITDVDLLTVTVQAMKQRLALRERAEPVIPGGLHPATADLVLRFATALAEKLHKAEQKYGYSDNWQQRDWYHDCLQSLWEHIEKGDPRDVAAYCAFMWHHGWKTGAPPAPVVPAAYEINEDATDYHRGWNACRAAMLKGNDE